MSVYLSLGVNGIVLSGYMRARMPLGTEHQ